MNLLKLESEKAQKELRLFTYASLALGILSLILWFLSIAAMPFAARALVLTFHKANKTNVKMRAMAIAAFVISTASFALGVLGIY